MNFIINKKFNLIANTLSLFLASSSYAITNESMNNKTLESNVNSKEKENIIEKYTIDSSHSKVSFKVAHLVISSVTGEFKKFEGTFKFNPKDFSQTELDASTEAASIDTATSDRDEHLKESEYFDAKKFPLMTFKSTSTIKTGEKTFDLKGIMTIKGIEKLVTFNVTYVGQIKSSKKMIQVFTGKTTIKRKDFGLLSKSVIDSIPVVGEEVTIQISAEGVLNSNAKS